MMSIQLTNGLQAKADLLNQLLVIDRHYPTHILSLVRSTNALPMDNDILASNGLGVVAAASTISRPP